MWISVLNKTYVADSVEMTVRKGKIKKRGGMKARKGKGEEWAGRVKKEMVSN